jgi:hypothetical protein
MKTIIAFARAGLLAWQIVIALMGCQPPPGTPPNQPKSTMQAPSDSSLPAAGDQMTNPGAGTGSDVGRITPGPGPSPGNAPAVPQEPAHSQ